MPRDALQKGLEAAPTVLDVLVLVRLHARDAADDALLFGKGRHNDGRVEQHQALAQLVKLRVPPADRGLLRGTPDAVRPPVRSGVVTGECPPFVTRCIHITRARGPRLGQGSRCTRRVLRRRGARR